MITMPKTGFYTTPHARWKVFLWAITHSRLGIEDCLLAFQSPVRLWRWRRYHRVEFQFPVTVHIPPYLIAEYGEEVIGTEYWDEEDIPNISMEEGEL